VSFKRARLRSILAQAEQRFAALPEKERRSYPRPAWLVAAQDREAAADQALETIYRQLADTPAESKFGLAMKLQIVVLLYGENVGDADITMIWSGLSCSPQSEI